MVAECGDDISCGEITDVRMRSIIHHADRLEILIVGHILEAACQKCWAFEDDGGVDRGCDIGIRDMHPAVEHSAISRNSESRDGYRTAIRVNRVRRIP